MNEPKNYENDNDNDDERRGGMILENAMVRSCVKTVYLFIIYFLPIYLFIYMYKSKKYCFD